MRTDEERIKSMHRRAAELKKEKQTRQRRILQGSSIAASFALILILSVVFQGLSEGMALEVVSGVLSASIFSRSCVLEFLVIGIIAFLLGVAVTMFCFHLKECQDEKNGESR